MTGEPVRHESEHRRTAVMDLENSLAVEAGAGAGKTTVLVDRFVNIARQPGLGPDRILAITFTRKAAVEMKERAIRTFEQAGEVQLRRATEAAFISTIHGFCERILRERAFEAGIDPAFTVLTEYEKRVCLQEALQALYARERLRAFAPRLGRAFDGGWRLFRMVSEVERLLREGAASARRELEVIDDVDACVGLAMGRLRESVEVAAAEMLACMERLAPLLADDEIYKSRKKSYDQAREYLTAVSACIEARSAAAAGTGIWTATGFTRAIIEEAKPPIRAELDAIRGLAARALGTDFAAQEALERELYPLKREIYHAAREIGDRYAAHKASLGALDFHDLQVRALALLREQPRVREHYVERFRHVLLDESQDTDELQYQLIEAACGPETVRFMVGDPKQCIYEFRGANPDVFAGAMAVLPAEHRLQLGENFRSRPEVVAFINTIGRDLLPGFQRIDAQANYGGTALDGPAVTTILSMRDPLPDGDGARVEDLVTARTREAAALAEEVIRLLKERTQVRDPHRREVSWTDLKPGHVAMLFRTRTAIPYFERALADRGVPYVTAAGAGFYDRAEVLDAMMLLRAVEQPLDDLAMAALLRSPFVGATDEALLELRMIAGSAGALYPAARMHEGLRSFRQEFSGLRLTFRGRPAIDVLDAAVERFGYEMAIAAHADGRAMLANFAKVRRQVRDLGAATPGEAYRALVQARELLVAEAQAALVGGGDDVLVLTTIHDAKGLEWPIVCLPDLQSAPRKDDPVLAVRDGTLVLEALDGDGEAVHPMSLDLVRDAIRNRADAEARRIMYVALTRARERLILTASITPVDREPVEPKGFGAPLPFLMYAGGPGLYEAGEHDGPYRTLVRHVRGNPPVTAFGSGETLAPRVTHAVVESVPPEPALPQALPVSVKVTELLSWRRCPQVYRFAHSLEIDEHLARRAAVRGAARAEERISPVELGTLVHGMLERARFDAADIEAEILRLVEGEPESRRARLRQMLEPVVGGEFGAMVRAAKRVEREWPFAMQLGGVLVEGVIDLALQHEDGSWTIVDYKSNDFSRSGRLEYLEDYYGPQLELYAAAVAQAGLGPVNRCSLVFLNGPVMHSWHVGGAHGDTLRWAEETVAGIASRNYSTTAGPKCEMCGYRKRKVCATGQGWSPDAAAGVPSSGESMPA